jgi:two-component system sensor histidine kinase TctE
MRCAACRPGAGRHAAPERAAGVCRPCIDTAGPLQKHLHVGLTPQGGKRLAREVTLLGETDLPAPPPARAGPTPLRRPLPPCPPASSAAPRGLVRQRLPGRPVRVVALQSQVVDGPRPGLDLLIQVAESTLPRDRAQAATSAAGTHTRCPHGAGDGPAGLAGRDLVAAAAGAPAQIRAAKQGPRPQAAGHQRRAARSGAAGRRLNQHVASYRALLEQQSQFLADASHQLRTPLAIMLTQAGVALREKDTEQLHATLRAMVARSRAAGACASSCCRWPMPTRMRPPEGAPGIVDLNGVAKDVVLQYLALAHEKNQDLGWVDSRRGTEPMQDAPRPGAGARRRAARGAVQPGAQRHRLHAGRRAHHRDGGSR